jgi:hypothetical protein
MGMIQFRFPFFVAVVGSIVLLYLLATGSRLLRGDHSGEYGAGYALAVAHAEGVREPGTPPTATLTLDVSPSTTIAPGDVVTFTATTGYFTETSRVEIIPDPTRPDETLVISPLMRLDPPGEATGTTTHTYTTAGVYTVTAELYYTDTLSLRDTKATTITVEQQQQQQSRLYLPVVALAQKPQTITLAIDPQRMPANGNATFAVTAAISDTQGAPLRDYPVTFVRNAYADSPADTEIGRTDSRGIATGALTAPLVDETTEPVQVDVMVSAGNASGKAGATFFPPATLTLNADKVMILADGADTTLLHAGISDAEGQPVPHYPMTVWIGTDEGIETTSGDDGIARIGTPPRTRNDTANVTARAGARSQMFLLLFNTAPCDDNETLNNSVRDSEPPALTWPSSGLPLTDGACEGSLEAGSGELQDDDYYGVSLNTGNTITARLTSYPAGTVYDIYLFPPEARVTPVHFIASSEQNQVKEFRYTLPAGQPVGTYYLRVYKTSGPPAAGTYTLDVTLE